MNIYEIKATENDLLNYLAGFAELDDLPEAMRLRIMPDGENEDIDAINAMLAELDAEKGRKVDYLGKIYKNAQALAEALKAEKMAIAKRQASAEGRAERLKALIGLILTDADGNVSKYESASVKITTRRSEVVDFAQGFDVETLPDCYCRIKREASREALKKAIKAGEAVPDGVYLKENINLTIK